MVGEGPTPSEGRPNPPRILPLDKDLRWRVALASWGSASQTHQLPDMSQQGSGIDYRLSMSHATRLGRVLVTQLQGLQGFES